MSSSGSSNSSGPQSEKKKTKQNFGSCQQAKEAEEHDGDGDTSSNWCPLNGPQRLEKETGDQKKNQDYHNNSIVKNS